jgi:uncharacterized cupredoxin-like copper-binding protein
MKTPLIISLTLAAAVSAISAEEKTLGEKTGDVLEKAGESARDAGHVIVDKTKKAAGAVKDALTPDKDARRVEVTLKEHEIEMPESLEAGKIAFVVRNAGSEEHNFEIEGQGIEEKFLTDLAPKDTKVLNLRLKPGTYKVYCPVEDHGAEGMKRTVTVK